MEGGGGLVPFDTEDARARAGRGRAQGGGFESGMFWGGAPILLGEFVPTRFGRNNFLSLAI